MRFSVYQHVVDFSRPATVIAQFVIEQDALEFVNLLMSKPVGDIKATFYVSEIDADLSMACDRVLRGIVPRENLL